MAYTDAGAAGAMPEVVLASASPRRRALLEQMGVPYRVLVPGCSEEVPAGTRAEDAPLILAERKARAAAALLPADGAGAPVLAADTLVVLGGRALGKARDGAEAASFLGALAGRTHTVVTGVALLGTGTGRMDLRAVATEVEFAPMAADEIRRLVATGEWQGAAGAYKIQGRSACFVRRIAGDYTGVVGLPISAVYDMLCAQGFLPRAPAR